MGTPRVGTQLIASTHAPEDTPGMMGRRAARMDTFSFGGEHRRRVFLEGFWPIVKLTAARERLYAIERVNPEHALVHRLLVLSPRLEVLHRFKYLQQSAPGLQISADAQLDVYTSCWGVATHGDTGLIVADYGYSRLHVLALGPE